MNADSVREAMKRIAARMEKNKMMLVMLDQKSGDGDLGISMADGFSHVVNSFTQEQDLGKLFMQMARVFNENAPSSLGTILSLGMMGMAQVLKGYSDMSMSMLSSAMHSGIDKIMSKSNSKPGEKTILDSICPAIEALNGIDDTREAFIKAAQAAAEGAEATRSMRAVHGRAAYYGDKSIGLIDGGAVVGKLIFEAIADTDGGISL